MADDVDKKLELEDLQDLKTELILDCCSYRLWKEFKRGSKMSGELLSILRDLFIQNQVNNCSEELQKKLHCTRFICGLSEARSKADDGSITVAPLNQTCIAHADEICNLYPFSSHEQMHFKSIVKLQVILTAFQNGKIEKAKEIFNKLYDERGDDEEYQDVLRELIYSADNEKIQEKIFQKFPYDKFLRDVVNFLKPLQDKYDLPFLDKYEEQLDSVDEDRIHCSVLQVLHDHIFSDVDNIESSWESIISGKHPEVKTFERRWLQSKKKDKQPKVTKNNIKKYTIKRKTTSNQRNVDSGENSTSDEDDDDDDDVERTRVVISKLKESTKQLNDYVHERKSQSSKHSRPSPFKKKRWNQHQDNGVAVEWGESDSDDLANQPKIRLPSPKRILNITLPKPSKRRKKNPWTDDELSCLCKGVETYGEGNWSTILRMYNFGPSRTSVDLKDKWRNYCRKF